MPRAKKADPELVTVERDGAWWVATMPCVPGAVSQGRTRASALRNLAAAVRAMFATVDAGQDGDRHATGQREAPSSRS